MKAVHGIRALLLGGVISLFFAQASVAEDDLPAVQEQGAVRYLSGGIGIDEAQAMRAEARHYPLALTFALRTDGRNEFTSAVEVDVRKGGKTVFRGTSDGPYLFLDLPAGTYRVMAVSNGREQTKTISWKTGEHKGVVFEWPAED